MINTYANPNVDLRNLSEAELEIVVQVIQRDFELKAAEKARIRRYRRQLKEYDKRVSILASSNFNENFCVICFERFILIFVPKRCCYSCRHSMCRKCSVWIPMLKAYICLLCQRERNLKSMGCDWYYGTLKRRFPQDGSELVAENLYDSHGEYGFIHVFYRKICYTFKPEWMKNLRHSETEDAIITPNLLKKVKGAQITRYRQKIQAKWEEMQGRLQRLDQSGLPKAKKDEAWHYLVDEYKNCFRDILKEFSQYLYITLENYAARVDDPVLNINEQVISTVYEEVELMIGYKINYIPEDLGSVLSDVESTVSMFTGNQMEERLANAIVNKIIQDHSINELHNDDTKYLDHLQSNDDRSSSVSHFYTARPLKLNTPGGNVSGRSSAAASSLFETERSIEIDKYVSMDYSMPTRTHHNDDSISTTEEHVESDEVILSGDQIESILRYSNNDRRSVKHIIERTINVPYGEPIKLQFQLNGLSQIEVNWTKTHMSRSFNLSNSGSTEISEISNGGNQTHCLKIWQSTESDRGLYTASIVHQPIIEYTVNIIENNRPYEKPSFRLKLINYSCRTNQVGEFSAEAFGYPEPRISFYHNEKLIQVPSEKYKIEYKEHISRYILKVLNVSEQDHGTYSCVAVNPSGSCECRAQLQVTNIKFRFDKKIRLSRSTSDSSVEDDSQRVLPVTNIPKKDTHDNVFSNSGGPLDETALDSTKSPKALNSVSSIKSVESPSTVIGREVPDQFKVQDKNNPANHPRSVHSYSTEALDTFDSPSSLARKEAMKSSAHSLSNSNTNISKLKQIFEQPSNIMHRNSSITGRTPVPDVRGPQSPFTKEVRVASYDYSN